MTDEMKRKQDAETAMREARDRKTQGPKGGAGEPRFRSGADKPKREDGWAEVPGDSEPPRDGAKANDVGDREAPPARARRTKL